MARALILSMVGHCSSEDIEPEISKQIIPIAFAFNGDRTEIDRNRYIPAAESVVGEVVRPPAEAEVRKIWKMQLLIDLHTSRVESSLRFKLLKY